MLENRVKRLQELMSGRADYAIITVGPNFFYLTGKWPLSSMERPFFLVVPRSGEPFVLAPALYESEIKELKAEKIIYKDGDDPYALLRSRMKRGTILIDDGMPASHALRIQMSFENSVFDLLSPLMLSIRAVKDREELESIRKACAIVDRTFERAIDEIYSGVTEAELAQIINDYMIYYGASGPSFETIVASGPNSAEPHHSSGPRRIRKGDAVVMDFGARYRGYVSDITRTVLFGSATSEFLEVYDTVRRAQSSAIKGTRRGMEAREVDSIARGFIASRGMEGLFKHRTGHGIGIEVHEEPFLDPSNRMRLENGMTFTIEPGVYVEGKFGVRIEDDVVLLERPRRLTRSTRSLITI
ncbi:MAG: M24 family metallopeptidase [Nitrososphaeria archaeon]